MYGVFPVQPADEIELLFHAVDLHNQSIRSQLRPGRDDIFMRTQSVKDATAGFCTQPMTHSQLLRVAQGKPFRLIPRCIITQSSGKQRIIDNADVGSSVLLCGRPSTLLALALMHADHFHAARESDSWEGGGKRLAGCLSSLPPAAPRGFSLCGSGTTNGRRRLTLVWATSCGYLL